MTRPWLPPLILALGNGLVVVLLLGVGMYYDHQRMPPGWITVAAVGLLCGPALRDAIQARRRELTPPSMPDRLLPEVQAALRLVPLYGEHGPALVVELEELLRRKRQQITQGTDDV